MRKIRITITCFIVIAALLVDFGAALAVPPLPSSFYGKVSLNGSNLPEGTVVEAIINDKVISESQTLVYQGQSVFSIDITGDDPSTGVVEGGKENDVVRFRIGGLFAEQTGLWHSGTNVELNLTIVATNTPQPPEPTKSPVPTQTTIVQPTQIPTTRPTQTSTAAPAQTNTARPAQTNTAAPAQTNTARPAQTSIATPTIAATSQSTQIMTPQTTSIVSATPEEKATQPTENQEVIQTEQSSEMLPTQQDTPESTHAGYFLNKGENGSQSQKRNQLTILVISLIIVIVGILSVRRLLNRKSKN